MGNFIQGGCGVSYQVIDSFTQSEVPSSLYVRGLGINRTYISLRLGAKATNTAHKVRHFINDPLNYLKVYDSAGALVYSETGSVIGDVQDVLSATPAFAANTVIAGAKHGWGPVDAAGLSGQTYKFQVMIKAKLRTGKIVYIKRTQNITI